MDNQLERNSAMRQWARLLVIAGNKDIAAGNTNEGIEKYQVVIRMGQLLCQQPTLIDVLVGFACEALGLGAINNFAVLGDANELYLDESKQAVSEIKYDWNTDLLGFIESEKIFSKNLWGVMCYQINEQGRIRFSHDPWGIFRENAKKQLANGNTAEARVAMLELNSHGYWYERLMKAFVILYWFYVPENPEKLSEIVDASFENHYLMTKPDFNWPQKPQMPPEFHYKVNLKQVIELLAKSNESLYFNIHDLYLRQLSQQKGSLLIIALRRYKNANGYWPENLDDIKALAPVETFIDPMNGDSFVYKLNENNFMLYSKGKNGIDESGEEGTKFSNNYRKVEIIKDDMMIWPTGCASSKQQEQKTNE